MDKLNILYEDNHIIVVEKIQNIPSQADESKDADMLSLVKEYIKKKYNKPGNVFLGLVHRLDRPVGGVMVFARTSKAAARLSEQIRNRIFKKTYLAIVDGAVRNIKGTLKDFLYKDISINKVKVVSQDYKDAKEAVLDYEVVETVGNMSLVRINLHTGRPHQIRVQFANFGHYLVGDQKYGDERKYKEVQIALWACAVEFEHPVSREIVRFELKPPKEYPWKTFEK